MASYKRLKGGTAEYNKELTNSLSLINRINSAQETAIAKTKSLNRETINTKEIEKELYKVKTDANLAKQKADRLAKALQESERIASKELVDLVSEQAEARIRLNRLIEHGTEAEIVAQRDILKLTTDAIVAKEDTLEVEQMALAGALQAQKVAEETADLLKSQLDHEKEIRSSLGYTGAAMNAFANKLGIGEKYYAAMVSKARDLNEEGKKITFADKLGGLAKVGASSAWEALSDPFTSIPLAGAAIGGVVKGLKAAFDFMLGIEDSTVKFGRAMNLSREDAKELKMHYASINISNGNLFVNTQKLMESQTEMVQMLGVTNRLSDEILSSNIELKDIAGVEAETRKGLAVTATITGKTMKETTKSVLAQVVGLKNATGIQFEYKEILKEATSLGGYLGLQFAKYPAQLAKSLVTVKAMGMEIKQLDGMADSFLDFESSISKEFEAQLLTGKEINLNKARELFLNNDLAGAAAEITSQVGSSADFMKMNRIQADSFAQAFGMSRDQLGDMLKQQEQYAAFGAKNTKELQAQVMMYKQQGKEKEAIAKLGSEEAYQSMINASMQEKIAAFMDKIKQSIADFVEKSGLIDVVQRAMDWLSEPKNIRAALMTVRDVFANIMDIVASVASGIIGALNFFGAISDQKESELKGFLEGAGDKVRSLGGDMAFVGTNVSENATKKDVGATNSQGGGASSTKFAAAPQTIVVHNQMNMDGQAMTTSMNNANNRNAGLKGDGSQLFSPSK
jgi:hypothetical protein